MPFFNEIPSLIKKIEEGCVKSENKLYDISKKIISCYLNSNWSNKKEHDDWVSDILLKVFESLFIYDTEKSQYNSWVISIAKNYMYDQYRGKNFKNTTLEYIEDINTSELKDISIVYSYGENMMTLPVDCVNISDQDYKFLNMKYVEGYSYKEIGDHFNYSSTTIGNRVNYVKSKIKREVMDFSQ